MEIKSNELQSFDKELSNKTFNFLLENNLISELPPSTCFHYTSSENADKIMSTRTLLSRYIRDTSDPFEYAGPMLGFREFVTTNSNLMEFDGSPQGIYEWFTELANRPRRKMYFTSFATSEVSEKLKTRYGNAVLQFNFTKMKNNEKGLIQYITCTYSANPYKKTYELAENWRDSVLRKVCENHDISNRSNNEILKILMMNYLSLATVVSTGLKHQCFEGEDEFRFVFYPINISRKPMNDWHCNEETHVIEGPQLKRQVRIYLEKLNITVQRIG